jgi:type IV pilus assembly protein PilQ
MDSARHQRSLIIAGAIAAAVAVTLTANTLAAARIDRDASASEASPATRAQLRAISTRLDSAISTVLIEATEPVAYTTRQPDPLTVLVDLRNVRGGEMPPGILIPQYPVRDINVEETTAADGTQVARVRVRLAQASKHRVRSARNMIYVEVDRVAQDGAVRVEDAREPKAAAVTPPARRAARTLKSVRVLPEGAGISLLGDGELVAATIEEAKDLPHRVLLDFRGVSAKGVPAVTEVNGADIKRVRVGTNSASPLITRVVIDLVRKLGFRVEHAGDNNEELRVLFDNAPATAVTDVPAEPGVVPSVADAPQAASVPAEPSAPRQAQTPGQMTLAQQAAPGPVQVNQPPSDQATAARFQGHTVTLDFQGADLRSVLRTFAEISGLNIVIDPSIQGTVDVSLKDVPWDQALDIILRANKLGYAIDGTVVRISPLNVLAQEQEENRKLIEAQALAGELRVVTLPLSYAKAPDLVAILTRSALSARGEVQVDTRTNTLIVRDLADRLTTATELVRALDRPQPQVEIEARIVQTTRDFARALGVEWGFQGRVDPTLGNTTPMAFPNRGGITGRTGGVQGPTQGDTTADRGVNLGVAAASSAVGIALGSINGAVNLDVVLSQLESSGRGRLLSTPRVSTQNNVEAEMTQGVQIPIQTVANNTVTVNFKDAALTLKVTPQITASNTVIMRVFLENATPDFSRAINGIPPIDTQRAVTTVLVADGETTVIGGIYVSLEQTSQDRVPLMHRIPLLGWLFKRDTLSDESRELLIFITPRITKG